MDTKVHFSTGKDTWETPPELFDELDAEFLFTLDVAATRHNAKCEGYIGPDHNFDNPGWLDALQVE